MEQVLCAICALLCLATSLPISRENEERRNGADDNNNSHRADDNNNHRVDNHGLNHRANLGPSGRMDIRLSDGYYGRVEVWHKNDWEPIAVIDPSSNANVGRVICRQLGYGPMESAAPAASNIAPVISAVSCDGRENNLQDCAITWGQPEPQGHGGYPYYTLKVRCRRAGSKCKSNGRKRNSTGSMKNNC